MFVLRLNKKNIYNILYSILLITIKSFHMKTLVFFDFTMFKINCQYFITWHGLFTNELKLFIDIS